jgi:hypothetical protein
MPTRGGCGRQAVGTHRRRRSDRTMGCRVIARIGSQRRRRCTGRRADSRTRAEPRSESAWRSELTAFTSTGLGHEAALAEGRPNGFRPVINSLIAPAPRVVLANGKPRYRPAGRRPAESRGAVGLRSDIPCAGVERRRGGPRQRFRRTGSGSWAAVKNAHEAVAELAQGGVVAGAAGAEGGVVGAGTE